MGKRWFVTGLLVVIAAAVLVSPVWADGPVNRTERAEVRFLEGMIDHHQMALDMAYDCLSKASTQAVWEICQSVITAQAREIAIMRGWLLIWYGVEYHPMSMMGMHHMQGGMMDGGMMQGGMMQGGMMDGGMMDGGMMQNNPAMQGTPTAPAPVAPDGQHDQHHPGAAVPPAPGAGPMPGGMGTMDMMEPAGMMGMMAWLHRLTGVDYEIAWLESMIDHHDDALHMAERILEVTERPELQALAQGIIDAQTGEIEQMEALITALGASS